jgi:U4/U6.U5 tri-snRNP-associated protein 3
MERMKQMMGISSFGSTKGKKVQADVSGVFKPKKSNYRQYMNRERGFNRPLSPPPAEKPRHSRDLTPGN